MTRCVTHCLVVGVESHNVSFPPTSQTLRFSDGSGKLWVGESGGVLEVCRALTEAVLR